MDSLFPEVEWVRVAELSALPAGRGAVVEAGPRVIALFNVDGVPHAIGNTCPHAGGPLGHGRLNGTTVACPLHGWAFDVRTGALCTRGGVTVERYEAKVEDGAVFVAV